MEGTKSDQSNMETSDSQNDESLLQFDAETVKLLVMRGDELLDCVTIWEERYGALEEEMETKEAQHKQQLQENLVTINLLKRREEELIQSQEKSTKDLAEKQQSWESEKQGMKYVVEEKNYQVARNHTLETEKQKMELKLKQVMKHNTYQTCKIKAMEKEVQKLVDQLEKQGEKISMETKLKEVSQEKDDLAKKNLSCETELKQVEDKLKQVEEENEHLAKNNKSWETDVKQLKDQMREKEDNFSKDLAEEHLSCETKVNFMKTTFQEEEKKKDNLVLKMLIGETVVKAKFEKAKESIYILIQENKSWEIDFKQKDMKVQQLQNDLDEQEKKFSEDLAEKHQSWATQLKQVEAKCKQVQKQKNHLAKLKKSWETDVKQLEDQMREKEEKFSEDLTQKDQRWETRVILKEIQLKQAKESCEAKEKKMDNEKTLLEDLCLHMKNKSRGFFARRRATEERDAILQKMLRKMQEKEMRKKAKGEKEEKEEAGRQ
ncbi:tropomyosin beta chain-like [Gymnodraco acuticeps]|uniref:Tropomyosin beta chain-like n=1 Tax=Gymnodraco acuticeps TaxID=8218 RepID=A0A6P8TLJ4_GYMAC|nr:tropomyosin beta chain-like [Gymnodraco acuticeps]